MDEVKKAIHLAMQELRKEYGEEAQLEDGDDVVTVFNNCVLIAPGGCGIKLLQRGGIAWRYHEKRWRLVYAAGKRVWNERNHQGQL